MLKLAYVMVASFWLVGAGLGMGQSQPMPGEMDMTGSAGIPPKEYIVLPVPRGDLESPKGHSIEDATVKTPDGEKLGTLERLIMDSKTGQVEYGVISLEETQRLVPVQWSAFKINRQKGEVVLHATKEQLEPIVSEAEMKDMSPDIKELVKQMEDVRAESPRKDGAEKEKH